MAAISDEQLDVQLETIRQQLAETSTKVTAVFERVREAGDTYRAGLNACMESFARSRPGDRAAFDAAIQVDRRLAIGKVAETHDRLREAAEKAVWRLDKKLEEERVKCSKKLGELLRFLGGMAPQVAMMMRENVKSEAAKFGLDVRKYSDAVRKAAETCHTDIGKALDKHERTLAKIGGIEGVEGEEPARQLRNLEQASLNALRSSTEPAVIFG